jgi:hypothetical protein
MSVLALGVAAAVVVGGGALSGINGAGGGAEPETTSYSTDPSAETIALRGFGRPVQSLDMDDPAVVRQVEIQLSRALSERGTPALARCAPSSFDDISCSLTGYPGGTRALVRLDPSTGALVATIDGSG